MKTDAMQKTIIVYHNQRVTSTMEKKLFIRENRNMMLSRVAQIFVIPDPLDTVHPSFHDIIL